MGDYRGALVNQSKSSATERPARLQASIAELAEKIDVVTETHGITRSELFALVSEVLDGNING